MMDLDFEPDWDILDFTETVTLRKVDALTGTTTDYPGVQALGRASLSPVVEPGGVQMTPITVRWHLRASSISGTTPARGDRIVSVSRRLSGTYAIESVNLMTDATRYECESQKLLT